MGIRGAWRNEGRLSKRLARLLALCAALLMLCGGAATAQGTLEAIREKGALVIGTDATYPPFEFVENGAILGFDVDLGNAIGKELGVDVRWVNINWDGIFGALETGKFDLVMSGVTITEERKKARGFSRPYVLSGQTIARRKGDARIQTSKDLPGKVVGVQQETTGQFAVEKLGIPKERIHRFETLQDALQDVQNGNADAAVGDLPALAAMIRKGYPGLELTGGIFVSETPGIVARRRDTQLIAAVNAALERIFVDGRYARIYEKWMREPLPLATLATLERLKDRGTPVPKFAPGQAAAPAPQEPPAASSWALVRQSFPLLLRGAWMTLSITFLSLLLGIPLGLLIALARLSPFRALSLPATVYTEVVRGTPLLMQIYVIYFVLPTVGISLPQMVAAVAALTLNSAAYVAEIFRAGIQSIDTGQMEAARALGMDYRAAMRWVILPQTLRRVLPPLTNEAVALLKDSSLVSVIALNELTRAGKELATVAGSPGAVYLAMALLYLGMTLPLTHLVRRLEAKWQPVSRPRLQPKQALQPQKAQG